MSSTNGVKADERPESAVCNVEDCSAWKTGDLNFCHHHKGMAKGGGTENNGNAVKHNLDADRSKLWERMPDTRQEVFEGIVESLRERYEEYHGREPVGDEIEDFREIAWSVIEKRYARDYMAECMDETGNPLMERVTRTVDGEKVTFEQPNGLLGRISENRREDRLLKKHTGLYKDPESQQADASKEQAELVRKALQED
jgi:cation transport regulator ChaB